MKKKRIHFHMINDENITSFDSFGVYENNTLSFVDHENQKNSIVFKQDKVEYSKLGSKLMHYVFSQGVSTQGVYQVDQFELVFQIETTFIEYSNKHLYVHFTLRQDGDIVGHHQLKITFKDEED